MKKRILDLAIAYRRKSFIRVAYRTFATLFPFVLIGIWIQIINTNLLQPDGFLYNVLYLANWTSTTWLRPLRLVATFIQNILLGFIGIYVVYLAAYYAAQLYQRAKQLAGVTGIVVMLMASYQASNRTGNFYSSLNWRMLSLQNLLLSLAIGYLIGQVFRWLSPATSATHNPHTLEIQSRAQWNLKPIIVSLIIGIVLGVGMNLANYFAISDSVITALSDWGAGDSYFIIKLLVMMLISLLQWLGLYDPTSTWFTTGDSAEWNANLSYVLSHHSMYHVPYPLSGVELYSSYAVFGGVGCTLALLIAFVLVSRRLENLRVARWNMIPVLFNNSGAFFIGLPVILNPIFLLAMIIIPAINMLMAAGAVMIHLIPTPVFDYPNGTPTFLVSFIGTNGNWASVIFAILLFCLDIIMYLPVVRTYIEMQNEIIKLDLKEDQQ